jgi:hypothetical protein
MQHIDNYYKSERLRIDNEKERKLSKGAISQCTLLYKYKNSIPNMQERLRYITENCKVLCNRLIKIYQDFQLKNAPRTFGFHNMYLGDRVTINRNYEALVDGSKNKNGTYEYNGILNMRTPVHEYLHYLSCDKTGMGLIKFSERDKIKAQSNMNRHKSLNTELTEIDVYNFSRIGFTEGITEMFAQRYLGEEISCDPVFKNVNKLDYSDYSHQAIIKNNPHYECHVAVVKYIEALVGDDVIREAYTKHDFDIIKRATGNRIKDIDWDTIMLNMAEIQLISTNKYKVKNTNEALTARRDKIKQILGVKA